jgi:hypothetical protein
MRVDAGKTAESESGRRCEVKSKKVTEKPGHDSAPSSKPLDAIRPANRRLAKAANRAAASEDKQETDASAELPAVAGMMRGSIQDFERTCLVLADEEQRKPLPNNALVATLCDGVRLCREYAGLGKALHEAASQITAEKEALAFVAKEVETIKTTAYAIEHAKKIEQLAGGLPQTEWKRIRWVLAKLVVMGLEEKQRKEEER